MLVGSGEYSGIPVSLHLCQHLLVSVVLGLYDRERERERERDRDVRLYIYIYTYIYIAYTFIW
jgi:hypothetical protein